jgi:hypothetical protein
MKMKMKNLTMMAGTFLLLLAGCTNIDEIAYDKYPASTFYATPEGSNAALANVYAQVAGNWGGLGYAGAGNSAQEYRRLAD